MASQKLTLWQAARQGGRSLLDTLKKIGRFGNALRYLIAFMLYNDGLASIIAFGGVYAAATFGWSTVTLGIFGIILTVFAISRGLPGRQARRSLSAASAPCRARHPGCDRGHARHRERKRPNACSSSCRPARSWRPAACSARCKSGSSWALRCCWVSAWGRCRRRVAP